MALLRKVAFSGYSILTTAARNLVLALVLLGVGALTWFLGVDEVEPEFSAPAAADREVETTDPESDAIVPVGAIANAESGGEEAVAEPYPVVAIVRIEFGNGEIFDVPLKTHSPDLPNLPLQGIVAADYDVLAAAANNGDGAAARHLHRTLRVCEAAFRESEAFESAIKDFKRTGVLYYPDGSHEEVPRGLSPLDLESMARDNFRLCDGVTDAQIEESDEWARVSAEAGDFLGMRDYARVVGYETDEGVSLYQDIWNLGYVSAAESLSIFYGEGYPSETSGRPDYVRSYAYLLITKKVYTAALLRHEQPSGQAANRIKIMDDIVMGKAGYMTANQIAEAKEIAADLVKNNPNCCIGGWETFR